MEVALKSFESLSDTDKIKFFQVLASGSSPQKTDLNILLGNVPSFPKENLSDENSQIDDSSKRQKTLDSWLIKSSVSPKQNKETATVVNDNSAFNVNIVSEDSPLRAEEMVNIKCAGNLSLCDISISGDLKAKDKDNEKLNVYSEEDKFHNAVELNKCGETSYNLRSKRKNSKVNLFEDDTCVKALKNNITSKIEINEANLLIQNPIVDSLVSVNSSISCDVENAPNFDSRNHLLGKVDINYNSASEKSSGRNKSYKVKTKKNSPKLQGSVETCMQPVSTVDANNCNKHKASESSAPSLDTTLTSDIDYEAFCKVKEVCSRIGLDIHEILQYEQIQSLLGDHEKYDDDAVIFVGAHRSTIGKILPVIHAHKSKKILLKNLSKV